MNLTNHLSDWLVGQSRKEHSVFVRAVATLLGATLFIAGIPAFVFWCGQLLDHDSVLPVMHVRIISLVLFLTGIPWVTTAVLWQLIYGKGTPVPVVPTKKFLQNGPYRYVRNPMIMGFFLYLLGWTFLSNQFGAFLASGLVIAILLYEIKFIEEPELEKRFGSAYLEYKKETPFMFPRKR